MHDIVFYSLAALLALAGISASAGTTKTTCKKCFVAKIGLKVDWWESYLLCECIGGKLASIRSQEEQRAVIKAINKAKTKTKSTSKKSNQVLFLGASCYPNCIVGGDAWYWTDRYPLIIGKNPYAERQKDKISGFEYWIEQNEALSKEERKSNIFRGSALTLVEKEEWRWSPHNANKKIDGYVCEVKCEKDCVGGPQEISSDLSFQGDGIMDLSRYANSLPAGCKIKTES